ncbi:hypothetical protein P9112_006855 [Eukaryota sp. TZLM1-RC]
MKTSCELSLSSILPDSWQCLTEFIEQQPDVEHFLSSTRNSAIIPNLDLTFYSLSFSSPHLAKVVILGQDPYPRKESANGLAFCDSAVPGWKSSFPPSLRNILLNLLNFTHDLPTNSSISSLRSMLKEINFPAPLDFFLNTSRQRVLWLNSVLTYENKKSLATHAKFWRPIVLQIFKLIFFAKLSKSHNHEELQKGLVVVLWGKNAQALKESILESRTCAIKDFITSDSRNASVALNSVDVEFVEAPHPCFTPFHRVSSFEMISRAQEKLGQDKIEWV